MGVLRMQDDRKLSNQCISCWSLTRPELTFSDVIFLQSKLVLGNGDNNQSSTNVHQSGHSSCSNQISKEHNLHQTVMTSLWTRPSTGGCLSLIHLPWIKWHNEQQVSSEALMIYSTKRLRQQQVHRCCSAISVYQLAQSQWLCGVAEEFCTITFHSTAVCV